MNTTETAAFVEAWVNAWNAHDVESVLEHFADDVLFTSPFAATVVDGSAGLIRGKQALRRYWTLGLQMLPDLRFEVVATYVGVDVVVVNYRNQRGGLVNEVLVFDGAGRVTHGYGTYLAQPDGDLP